MGLRIIKPSDLYHVVTLHDDVEIIVCYLVEPCKKGQRITVGDRKYQASFTDEPTKTIVATEL